MNPRWGSHTWGPLSPSIYPTHQRRSCSRAAHLATSVARKRASPIMLTPHSVQCLLCAQSETTCGELRPDRCGEAPRIIRGKRDGDGEARRKPTWTLKRRSRTKMRGRASNSIWPPCFYIHVHVYLEQSQRRGRKPASL